MSEHTVLDIRDRMEQVQLGIRRYIHAIETTFITSPKVARALYLNFIIGFDRATQENDLSLFALTRAFYKVTSACERCAGVMYVDEEMRREVSRQIRTFDEIIDRIHPAEKESKQDQNLYEGLARLAHRAVAVQLDGGNEALQSALIAFAKLDKPTEIDLRNHLNTINHYADQIIAEKQRIHS